MTRTCSKCGVAKKLVFFARRGTAYRAVCKSCRNAQALKWAHANPERRHAIQVAYARRKGVEPKKPAMSQEERKARDAEYYRRTKTAHLVRAKASYDNRREEVAQYQRDWRMQNSDRKKLSDRNWRQRNLARTLAYSNQRRARKLAAEPKWLTNIERAQIEELYEIARARSVQTGVAYDVDHIHPLKGDNFCGLHVPWNLEIIPHVLNVSKGSQLPVGRDIARDS